MPKKVDVDARREQVADAVIDEIVADGLRSVTLARISARSGLAIGSIRHYFGDTVREVMRFTLDVVVQRAVRRTATMSEDPSARIVDAVVAAAPTSEQELKETIALVEYRVMARTDAELGADIAVASLAAEEAIRSLLRKTMADRAIDEDALHQEAHLLLVLVEGLSFSAALQGAPMTEADVRDGATATLQRLQDAYPVAGPPADVRCSGTQGSRGPGRR